jgi:hypothetical protein
MCWSSFSRWCDCHWIEPRLLQRFVRTELINFVDFRSFEKKYKNGPFTYTFKKQKKNLKTVRYYVPTYLRREINEVNEQNLSNPATFVYIFTCTFAFMNMYTYVPTSWPNPERLSCSGDDCENLQKKKLLRRFTENIRISDESGSFLWSKWTFQNFYEVFYWYCSDKHYEFRVS